MTRGDRLTIWALRGLVALALAFFSEIVWWSSDPLALTADQWGTRAILYLVLAALLLDLMARFGVGELYGWLVLSGIYGLLNGALITGGAFETLPLSLVTRPLGLHTFAGGMLALLWLRWLVDGRGFVAWRGLALAAIGVLWGMWVRWYPLLPTNGYTLPSLGTALALVTLGLAVIGLVLAGVGLRLRGRVLPLEQALRLNAWAWGAVTGAHVITFIWEARAGHIGTVGGAILGMLVGYLVMLLYFLRGQARVSFLQRLGPLRPVGPVTYIVYGVLLVIPAALGYSLPGSGPDGLPLRAMTSVLTLFGILWLPGVSLGIGLSAYIRLFRQEG